MAETQHRHRLDVLGLFDNEYDSEGYRTCSVTGLEIHKSVENHVKLFGLTAVLFMVVGGFFAITVVGTRWEAIGLLSSSDYYIHLSMHAWSMLLFWIVFMEVAILYVGGPMVLGRKLPLTVLAKVGYAVMLVGALTIYYAIWTTSAPDQAPLLTAYVPLPSSPVFYAGALVFVLGVVVAALPFFVSIWQEKRANPGGTLPLVTFGAFITGIIAVEALLGGVVAFSSGLLWRLEIVTSLDAGWYRMWFWIVGHGTQQINLVAMIVVWYFLTHVVGGAEVVSEKVSRTAFILYLLFINMGAAHHLLVDPGISTGWRLWNTSYAFYGATFASLIHAFAIPAGIEAGRRKRGKGGGLFGWLTSAPWKNPMFAAPVIAIILFGFLGGITGVLMGQLQLNMAWHNTFATVGHFHSTVVLGTTITFMAVVYFVIRTMFLREFVSNRLASLQPFLYGGAMGVTALMMMYVGILYGVPRRTPEVVSNIPGTDFSLSAAEPLFVVFGLFAFVAIAGGALFVALAVGSLLFGKRIDPAGNGDLVSDGGSAVASQTMAPRDDLELADDPNDPVHAYEMRGTFVLCLLFLAAFVITYVLNWYLITQLWSIGA
ncbi:cbb3-type cytochrome c oxidase subunit I [Halobacteria archaeon AArc-m2/3/4]|uniref:Cbb3-type cytochrome c oxidase subunit I n=1 Tax=Natronoglomus mannanivorans TaxID=2979990 RepID=A0AAP3E1C4_9EURY|nr:cbb3-type cytochrome c oxidase subunit I [Halobacteria archaeon AArc-xg1-1]MCU4975683.1 cbb3-type cytochrome c oxidase subunit I [Halobacteria archaeon AArc-m2/3/4]